MSLTIHKQWLAFEEKVIPENASVVQRIEMMKSFYCGAWSLMGMMIYGTANMTDEDAEKAISALEKECETFILEICCAGEKHPN